MTDKPAYLYKELKHPSTIRLLHLHPDDPSESVHFSLTTVPLDEDPVYEAISYSWGDPRLVQPVICEDASILPPASLVSALLAFRLPDRTRVLWADAICIDQANNDEKGRQVLLMPRIYSQATRVLIWLGPEDDDLEGLDQTIKVALEFLPPDTHDAVELGRQSQALLGDMVERQQKGQPSLISHNWRPLINLLRRPWFCRKWVVQEVSLAKEAIMFAGHIELPWTNLGLLAFKMESLGATLLVDQWRSDRKQASDDSSEDGAPQLSMPPLHNTTIIHLIKHYRGAAALFDCVVATVGFLCTDERDHVYALLSLPLKPVDIYPDYKMSTGEVFQKFAAEEMTGTQSLKLLGLAPDKLLLPRPDQQRLDIPSWVPDLRRLGDLDTLVSYNIREQIFHAGGHSKPIFSISDEGKILRSQGRDFDSVKVATPTLIDMVLSEQAHLHHSSIQDLSKDTSEARLKRMGTWVLERYELAGRPFEAVPVDAERSMAFARTMICGMSGMRDRPSVELFDAVPAFIEHMTATAEGKPFDFGHHAADVRKYWLAIDQSIVAMSAGRRFCVTEAGRFGQLPRDSEVGDRLCVLVGAEVPFVIRPTGRGTYRMIGECYVDGVMNGEILEADEFTTKEIRLE